MGNDKEAFTEAFIYKVAGNVKAKIPEIMVDQKLKALLAQDKMTIGRDPIYNLLADMVEILKKAYHSTGIGRSMAQIRSEAMDIMLQTMSKDQKEPSKDHLYFLIKKNVANYRDLPPNFDEKLDKILEDRKETSLKMTADERLDDAFDAYLGSLDLTEEMWLEKNRDKALVYAKFDLLLDAVIEAEPIVVTDEEIEKAFMDIAKQCSLDAEEVKATIDGELLKWQLQRDKAKDLILNSAVNA